MILLSSKTPGWEPVVNAVSILPVYSSLVPVAIGDFILDLKPKLTTLYFEKLIGKVFDIIGTGFSVLDDEEHRYDYSMAESEKKLFDAKSIPKPGLIPPRVSNIKFEVDLTGNKSINHIKYKSLLMKAL